MDETTNVSAAEASQSPAEALNVFSDETKPVWNSRFTTAH